ncbi:MAG: hypothetical protein NC548_50980 [Lachnospiraceae bacterium]|nr:hypothetical protein [Lachnospiraceae bacterium]
MQFDNRVTFHCCSEAFRYKFRDLKLPSAGGSELYGFSFPDILKSQGVTEKIVTDMRDKPWYFELQPGSLFGLFEYLKRQRIHCSIISDENDDALFVMSRRYPVALDRGRSFKRGVNIIDFKDAVVKKDLADDYQYNLDAVIARHFNFPVDLSKVSRDKDGYLQGLPPSDAVISVQWPEWRGRKFDIQFWGVPWDAECALECHDAAIRSSVRRGEFELASLLAFGADFVEPYEKVNVSWLSEVDGEYVCVSNRISFSPDKGIRQFMRLFAPLPLPNSSDIKAQFNYLNR